MDKMDTANAYAKRRHKHKKLQFKRQNKCHTMMPDPDMTFLQEKFVCNKHYWIQWIVDGNGKISDPLPKQDLFPIDRSIRRLKTEETCWKDNKCVCANKIRVPVETDDDRSNSIKYVKLCRKQPIKRVQHDRQKIEHDFFIS